MSIIRRFEANDWPRVWEILHATIEGGDKFAFAPGSTEAEIYQIWIAQPTATFVALSGEGVIVGSYFLKPNQPGLGSHICNAGYVVAEEARGQGVATLMCQHSQAEAVGLGFAAMQFNFVVSTNHRAVELWQRLGFDIIGTVPGGFRHLTKGDVAAHIMFKRLAQPNRPHESPPANLAKP